MESVETLINDVRRGQILLPEFQRGYVCSSDQVRELVRSMYKNQGLPVELAKGGLRILEHKVVGVHPHSEPPENGHEPRRQARRGAVA